MKQITTDFGTTEPCVRNWMRQVDFEDCSQRGTTATENVELREVKIARIPLIIFDELRYVPIEAKTTHLFFQLVSTRYEKASLIIMVDLPFSRWGEVSATPRSLRPGPIASSTMPR